MLFKKMLRDMRAHKTQFLSIFLMAFLGVFVFAGVGGESVGLEESVNNYYETTNLADGWIYSANLDDSFVDTVNNLEPTTNSERQLVIDSVADFDNDPEITLHFIENNNISKFHVIEGQDIAKNANGIVSNVKGMTAIGGTMEMFVDKYITPKLKEKIKERKKDDGRKTEE